jgi:hypothetical protein
MTKRSKRHDDDDDDVHDGRILRDGEVLRTPMRLMDSVQSSIHADKLQNDAAQSFGLNDSAALHRPGYRFTVDAAGLDAKEQAYRDADLAQTNAWRGNDVQPSDTPKGNDREILLKQITGDSRLDAYLSYQEDVENRWRGGR